MGLPSSKCLPRFLLAALRAPCDGVRQGSVQLRNLLADEIEHVRTWAAAGPSDLGDFLDLVQVEAESPSLSDKGQGRERLWPRHSVAGRRPTGCRQNPRMLIEPRSAFRLAPPRRSAARFVPCVERNPCPSVEGQAESGWPIRRAWATIRSPCSPVPKRLGSEAS